jgi:hypothetical protein
MQRVRIGLTGLGFVFVAVLLATALTGTPEDEAPVTGNSAAPGTIGQAENPKEPLAELGVAPGNADNAAAPATNKTDSAFR